MRLPDWKVEGSVGFGNRGSTDEGSEFGAHRECTHDIEGELLPFSINELNNYETDTDSLIYKGGYPGIWCDGKDTYTFYSNYVTTYLERDVRNIINIKDLYTFQNSSASVRHA